MSGFPPQGPPTQSYGVQPPQAPPTNNQPYQPQPPGYNPPAPQQPPPAQTQQQTPTQQPWGWTGSPPNGQPPAQTPQAPTFDPNGRIPDAPGIPREFVGKTYGEAFGEHARIRDAALKLYRERQAMNQQQPQAPQPPQGTTQQQPTQQPAQPPSPQDFFRDPWGNVDRRLDQRLEERLNERLQPLQQPMLETAARNAVQDVRNRFPDFDKYRQQIEQVLGQIPDKTALASPQTWESAYYYVRGQEVARGVQQQQQPNGQNMAPWGSFFSERPTPPQQNYAPPQTQLTDGQRQTARMLGVNEADAASVYEALKRGEFPSGL